MNVNALASELVNAREIVEPVEPFSARAADLDWNVARRIARATDAIRRADGHHQIGWKLGWTSAVMREALGIDRPNWGTLWDDQRVEDAMILDRYIHPKIEPEMVWRSPADVRGADVTADEVAELSGEWALGLEIVDPRFPLSAFDALDNTADNSSAAGFALGAFVPRDSLRDLAAIEIHFDDGDDHRTGVSGAAMGSPLAAVAWLVRSLHAEGEGLREGAIVFTGGLTAPFDVVRGVRYTLAGDGLPPISLEVR